MSAEDDGSEPCERAGSALAAATHIVVAAGAGASADSGTLVFAQVSSLPALRRQGKTYDQGRNSMLAPQSSPY